VQPELTLRQHPSQVALQPLPGLGLDIHHRDKEAKRVAIIALGPVEGEVGMAEELIRIRSIPGEHGDADAGPDVHLLAIDAEGPTNGVDHLAGQDSRRTRCRQVGLNDSEFIATEPGERIGCAKPAADPLRHRAQQAIPGRVAEPVVGILEVVEVEEQSRNAGTLAPRPG